MWSYISIFQHAIRAWCLIMHRGSFSSAFLHFLDALNYFDEFHKIYSLLYEGWNFNSGNYLFTTDTK